MLFVQLFLYKTRNYVFRQLESIALELRNLEHANHCIFDYEFKKLFL